MYVGASPWETTRHGSTTTARGSGLERIEGGGS